LRDRKIGVYYCGEYGEKLGRPHYHLCLFNLDFPDKKRRYVKKGFTYYDSDLIRDLWPFGYHVLSSFSFDTAAYVARYVTKKIYGANADDHYGDKSPEFCGMSTKPAIGRNWIEKFGMTDVFHEDCVVIDGKKVTPPRYYDKYLESIDPDMYKCVKERRVEKAKKYQHDNSWDRLLTKAKCIENRVRLLTRELECA